MAKVTAIIRSAGFFLFGVGLAALGIMLPTSQLFEFAHEMLASLLPNVGGEFAADSLEKSLDHMFSAHEKAKFLKGFQEGLLKEETLKKIFGELKESMKAGNTDSEQRGIVKKFFDQLKMIHFAMQDRRTASLIPCSLTHNPCIAAGCAICWF